MSGLSSFGNSGRDKLSTWVDVQPAATQNFPVLFLIDMIEKWTLWHTCDVTSGKQLISQHAFRYTFSYFLQYLWTAIEIGGNPYFILLVNRVLIKYVKMCYLPSLSLSLSTAVFRASAEPNLLTRQLSGVAFFFVTNFDNYFFIFSYLLTISLSPFIPQVLSFFGIYM